MSTANKVFWAEMAEKTEPLPPIREDEWLPPGYSISTVPYPAEETERASVETVSNPFLPDFSLSEAEIRTSLEVTEECIVKLEGLKLRLQRALERMPR